MKNDKAPTCFHCGSALILISRRTEKLEGYVFPRTIFRYRCSNDVCQKNIDAQTAKRLKLYQDKEMMNKKRAAQRSHKAALS